MATYDNESDISDKYTSAKCMEGVTHTHQQLLALPIVKFSTPFKAAEGSDVTLARAYCFSCEHAKGLVFDPTHKNEQLRHLHKIKLANNVLAFFGKLCDIWIMDTCRSRYKGGREYEEEVVTVSMSRSTV